jgi:hypothetical protein
MICGMAVAGNLSKSLNLTPFNLLIQLVLVIHSVPVFIYGLLNSMGDEATMMFASAVAACVCLSKPHSINAPDMRGVLKLMEEYNR